MLGETKHETKHVRASHKALVGDGFEPRTNSQAKEISLSDLSRVRTARNLYRWHLEGSNLAEIGVGTGVAAFIQEVVCTAIGRAESIGQFEVRTWLYYEAEAALEHPAVKDFLQQLRGFLESPEFGYGVEFGPVVWDQTGHNADWPYCQALTVTWW